MKKIGILTYFWSHNAGTFLQAYSMLQAFSKRFPDDRVELVNYRQRRVYFKPSRPYVSFSQWVKDVKRYRIYKGMQNRYLVTSADGLLSCNSEEAWEYIERQQYDLIAVGSDTVLELQQRHEQNGSVPVYWLPPQIGCKKAMCAASARALTYEQLNDVQRRALKESVNSFDLLGVRDDATFDLIKTLGVNSESKVQMVPDPTFSYEIDYNCAERFTRSACVDFSRQSVALHMPRTITKTGERIAAYYRGKGFQILSIGPARYADLCLTDISPFEWAGLFKKFRMVITNRFHDTIFSLKNLTPVITVECGKSYVTDKGQSKYHSLLKQFGLHQSNLIREDEKESADRIIEAGDRVLKDFDGASVRGKLTRLKEDWDEFVDKVAKRVN
jgi:polysaccharide pyruvyl transferase WcaK-like protein